MAKEGFKYHLTPMVRTLLPTVLTLALFAGTVFFYFLPAVGDYFLDHKKDTIRQMTQSVIGKLESFEQQVLSGKLDRAQARDMALAQIRAMRYGPEGKDYFWVNDDRGVMLMHPYRSDLEGRELGGYRDREGLAPFQEFIRTAHEGGGFVSYYWQWKDQPEREVPKLSYVQEFQPWGWVVGTGIYLDDVQRELAAFRNRIAVVLLVILTIIAVLSGSVIHQVRKSERDRQKVQRQRERLLGALKAGEERYRTIADFAYDWEAWIGPDGTILYCSPSCERITGYPPEAFFENPGLIAEIIDPDFKEAWQDYLEQVPYREGQQLDFRILKKNGGRPWLSAVGRSVYGIGLKPLGLRFSFRDITERKNMEEQLRHQALHDPLTGLANRTLCLDRIRQAMERAKRRGSYFYAVVFIDLDRFKIINDSLGHRFGDMVLVETARRLTRHVRSLDTVARFGGDEFVFLLDELHSPREAIRIVKRLREEMAEKFCFDGHEVMTTASFGIVLSPTDYKRPEDLLQNANIAMHRAKDKGRNQFKVFTSRMLEHAVDQMNMENDMRRGLANKEFYLNFQPILRMDAGELLGFEALARWKHPTRGEIMPSEFIPMAEDSGLIMELGQWVLREALDTLARWRANNEVADRLFMAVNLSSRQLTQSDLYESIVAQLQQSGVPARNLKLEITESTLMDNPEMALQILNRLREYGVQFSIDDFGTGYSSLTQLQRLPVDTLKVDRSFISRLGEDKENLEIVRAVVALAHSLDLDVVAEGVENAAQYASLSPLECECVQGFLFHKPLSAMEAEKLIAQQSPEPPGVSGRKDRPGKQAS
ncbi:EAL domain-containing protein [Salidesulfovibrio onnuriiensis]|uniref:EAL domain-containing protein n=1 Tax=Salidesulfovibrio onnuriiensis TaxID=2583823 RepID=UPI0011CB679B|nr:EAL domain-containing protein [Salidesulfovibrio onnuriiensis]